MAGGSGCWAPHGNRALLRGELSAEQQDALDTYPLWVKLGISPPTTIGGDSASLRKCCFDLLTETRVGIFNPPAIIVLGATLGIRQNLLAKEYDRRGRCRRKGHGGATLYDLILILVSFVCLAYGLWGFLFLTGGTNSPSIVAA